MNNKSSENPLLVYNTRLWSNYRSTQAAPTGLMTLNCHSILEVFIKIVYLKFCACNYLFVTPIAVIIPTGADVLITGLYMDMEIFPLKVWNSSTPVRNLVPRPVNLVFAHGSVSLESQSLTSKHAFMYVWL